MSPFAFLPPSSFPLVPGICLGCRTVVLAGERCPNAREHRVVRLETPAGRDQLLTEVWGSPRPRRRSKTVSWAPTIEGGNPLTDGSGLATNWSPLVWAVKALASAWRRHRQRPRPCGAPVEPPTPTGRSWSGRALAADGQAAGVLARGLRLECERAAFSPVMLRDGRCLNLLLELDDGSRLQVPAGALRVEAADGLTDQRRPSQLVSYLRSIDPLRTDSPLAATADPIPFERAVEVTVQSGDRVELLGELDWSPDHSQPTAGYRSMQSIGVPRGPCVLRLLAQPHAGQGEVPRPP